MKGPAGFGLLEVQASPRAARPWNTLTPVFYDKSLIRNLGLAGIPENLRNSFKKDGAEIHQNLRNSLFQPQIEQKTRNPG